MFPRFLSPAPVCRPEVRHASPARPRAPRGRRHRSFHGCLEHLEERCLLSFGTGGIVTTQFDGGNQAFAIAIQPANQKILVGGDDAAGMADRSAWPAITPTAPWIPRFGTGGIS